jgi:colanic acid biosynthesis glycosyl transferase WcaI
MRVHQVTHLFHPDSLAGASLYTDLALYLNEKGHDVRVTTTFSYYPKLQYNSSDRGIVCREERFRGIPVRRIGMWLPRKHSGMWRLAPEVSYLGAVTAVGRFDGWRPDVVFVACPMLAQALWQRWLYLGQSVPRLLVVQDLMVSAASELGIVRSRHLGALLAKAERWALRGATRISTISEGMKERIDRITGSPDSCVVVPNWIHRGLASLVASKHESVRKRPGLTLFYSGNFGVKQGLPAFLQDMRDARGPWRMSLNGGGAESKNLRLAVADCGDWVELGGLLNEEAYVERLLGSTACLITQQKGIGANFLPSKLLPALSAGLPVLAVCDRDSPLGREVSEAQCGEVLAPGDVAGLRELLARWSSSPSLLMQYGTAAQARSARYSRDSVCRTYESIMMQLVRHKAREHQ